MTFFHFLRSIEELLYEVMTWLVFYPRTLWRTVRHPRAMAVYSDREQRDAPEEQFTDTLSPPLFLLLTVLLWHGLALSAGMEEPLPGRLGSLMAGSEQTLLLLRSVLFSLYPLMFAVGLVKRSGKPLDRKTLREPFYSQCYLGGLLATLVSASLLLARTQSVPLQIGGVSLLGVSVLWYMALQALWFSDHLAVSRGRGAWLSTITFAKATVVNAVFALVVSV